MMEVTFDVINMGGWLNIISSKHLTTVTILDCIPWKKSGGQAIIKIAEKKSGGLIEDLHKCSDIVSIDVNENNGSITGTVGMMDCSIIRHILAAGCFLEQAKAEGDGKVEFKVLAGCDGSIPELISSLNSLGLLIDIKRLMRFDDESSTTKRQRELVKIALDRGFFDYPKKVSIKELAVECGMAQSTLQEILRRAQKNILQEYFDADRK
ncbi:MAG: helix-turn-helix domain-containing protein [Methanomassiliicoccales archaeon]